MNEKLESGEAEALDNGSPEQQNAKAGTNLKRALKNTVRKFSYDFAVDGGEISTINLTGENESNKLPANIIVTKVISEEINAFTSGGSATIQLKAGSINLTGAIAFDSGFTGIDNQALASSVDGIKLTAEETVAIAIATAALTAGKADFYIEYYEV